MENIITLNMKFMSGIKSTTHIKPINYRKCKQKEVHEDSPSITVAATTKWRQEALHLQDSWARRSRRRRDSQDPLTTPTRTRGLASVTPRIAAECAARSTSSLFLTTQSSPLRFPQVTVSSFWCTPPPDAKCPLCLVFLMILVLQLELRTQLKECVVEVPQNHCLLASPCSSPERFYVLRRLAGSGRADEDRKISSCSD